MAKRKAEIENNAKPTKQQKTKKRITPAYQGPHLDLNAFPHMQNLYGFMYNHPGAREVPENYMRKAAPYMNAILNRIYTKADKWKDEFVDVERYSFKRPTSESPMSGRNAFYFSTQYRDQPNMISYQTEAAKDIALQEHYRNLHTGLRFQGKTMPLVGGVKNYVPPSTDVDNNLKNAALELRRLARYVGSRYEPPEESIL